MSHTVFLIGMYLSYREWSGKIPGNVRMQSASAKNPMTWELKNNGDLFTLRAVRQTCSWLFKHCVNQYPLIYLYATCDRSQGLHAAQESSLMRLIATPNQSYFGRMDCSVGLWANELTGLGACMLCMQRYGSSKMFSGVE